MLPASEPASKVTAIQRRRSFPWRTVTAGALGTTGVGELLVVALGGAFVVDVVGTDDVGVVAAAVVDVGGVAARLEVPQLPMTTTCATANSDRLR